MITIFTPTYNRADTLERLYKSLINQTVKNFEWIIIDDGSFDKTKEIVEKFIK
ncbi:MAG: glycosyltransferase family 2 protein, partial [Cetobacterium sp.]